VLSAADLPPALETFGAKRHAETRRVAAGA